MRVSELIDELKKQDPNATVYVDWDREGGNEEEVTRIEQNFRPHKDDGPKIALR